MIDQQGIAAALRRIGLGAGDRVVVHASLRAIGPVAGGPLAVVRAFLDVLGPDGLLVMPAFSYAATDFDPAREPGVTGLIGETVRSWPGAVRSWHPTHSVAAIGRGARECCADHERVGGLSVGSPLDKPAASGGFILLLGVGHNRNSSIHLGEAHARMPYLGVPFGPDFPGALPLTVDGQRRMVPIREIPGCSTSFGAVEGSLRRRRIIRDGAVGKATAQLMRGSHLIDAVVDLLADDPALLLCTSPDCYRCSMSRQLLGRPV